MATASTRRVISRTPRRPASRSGFAADCRWCKAPVLWLRSTATDKLAPIDAHPAPGGTVVVHRDGANLPTGTYDVVVPPRPREVVQAETLDLLTAADGYGGLGGGVDEPGDSDDEVLAPTRHVNHWVTCGSATARRLARERADRGVAAGPLRTVDGDPVGPRHMAEPVDVLGPPATVNNQRRCRACWQPMNAELSAAGERYHPTCGPDPGPEPDRP